MKGQIRRAKTFPPVKVKWMPSARRTCWPSMNSSYRPPGQAMALKFRSDVPGVVAATRRTRPL